MPCKRFGKSMTLNRLCAILSDMGCWSPWAVDAFKCIGFWSTMPEVSAQRTSRTVINEVQRLSGTVPRSLREPLWKYLSFFSRAADEVFRLLRSLRNLLHVAG